MNSKPSTGNTIPSARLAVIVAELRELEERRARLLTEQTELTRPTAPTLPFDALLAAAPILSLRPSSVP